MAGGRAVGIMAVPGQTVPVVASGQDGDGLARVDHADLDLLTGDLDAAPKADPPLHGDGPGRAGRKGCAAAGTADLGRPAGETGQGIVRSSIPVWSKMAIWVGLGPAVRAG